MPSIIPYQAWFRYGTELDMHISPRQAIDSTPASQDDDGLGLALVRARRGRRRMAWALIGAVIVAVGAFATLRSSQPPQVTISQVALQPVERVLAVTGRVRAKENISVLPKVSGQIVELFRDEGELVKAGEALGRIDDARARAAVEQAEAAVEAEARVLAQAERDLERARALRERGSATEAAVEASTLAVTRGREDLRRFRAIADESRLKLSEYAVTAPLDGRVLSRPIDAGQVVDTRTVLFDLAPVGGREIETEVDEAYSMALSIGQPARIALAGSAESVSGAVTYLSPQIDASTGGRIVRLSFDLPVGSLEEIPVGLSADVNIVVSRAESAVTIARAAIRDVGNTPHVFVVEGDTVTRRDITFADWPANQVIVEQGLRPGDRVILDPAPPPAGTQVIVRTP